MSEEVENDLWRLVDFQLEFAERQLRRYGEFYPYGAAISSRDDEVLALTADLGEGRPASQDMLDALLAGAQRDRADLRAIAFTADVALQGGGDAVRIDFEHASGKAAQVLVPYRRSRMRRSPTFLDLTATPEQPRIWVG